MLIHDVDFAEMYREHMRGSDRPHKPASAWDERARALSDKVMQSDYTRQFIARMDLSGAKTLLDVGCGPGTIGVSLASGLEAVHGLDYSPVMLECMMENAGAAGLDNVHPLLLSWTDDWKDVPVCDIVVASRSSIVPDMADALRKMTSHARLRCYMTHLVGGHFGDAGIAKLLGRQQQSFPDYIYIVNLLHGMGLYPRLDYMEFPGRLAGTANVEEFTEKVAWSFGELSDEDRRKLREWYEADAQRARQGGEPMRWAMISWDAGK
ncbi:class I SAM-dependent methyltransferase [Paracandidimonas soli]|uniref:Methyltransferase family protein n=1 Tax=Paracandidimonas soli TaxID=1917182 RepID=A0A4R3UT55_9BURK|nr:class I SAM-dependent methyltransferase [Paracandidimonas soli]TCU93843.1 methyltransferase family protein [Paracandidimonas soli]